MLSGEDMVSGFQESVTELHKRILGETGKPFKPIIVIEWVCIIV
jgi:hypothetical protein